MPSMPSWDLRHLPNVTASAASLEGAFAMGDGYNFQQLKMEY